MGAGFCSLYRGSLYQGLSVVPKVFLFIKYNYKYTSSVYEIELLSGDILIFSEYILKSLS